MNRKGVSEKSGITKFAPWFFSGIVLLVLFTGCISLKNISGVDISYFEKFRKDGEKLVFVSVDKGNVYSDMALYLLTNPKDIKEFRAGVDSKKWERNLLTAAVSTFSPVLIWDNQQYGKGLAVFSLPEDITEIYGLFQGVRGGAAYNQDITFSLVDDEGQPYKQDIATSLGFFIEPNTSNVLSVVLTSWNNIDQIYSSCNGKYGAYILNKWKQTGFIELK